MCFLFGIGIGVIISAFIPNQVAKIKNFITDLINVGKCDHH